MGLWSIVIPDSADVTNLVTNPSAETGTAGWAAVSGGTLAQSSAKQRRGYASLSYTSTTAIADGITFDSVTLVSGTTYTLAFDFWGASGVPSVDVEEEGVPADGLRGFGGGAAPAEWVENWAGPPPITD